LRLPGSSGPCRGGNLCAAARAGDSVATFPSVGLCWYSKCARTCQDGLKGVEHCRTEMQPWLGEARCSILVSEFCGFPSFHLQCLLPRINAIQRHRPLKALGEPPSRA
jgi:hypothetical protein